jgi:hypothetical protein
MTARQVYEGVLIELNKVEAPSLLLEDFNYLFNKAVYQYINTRYNIYDINQQTTDDVRVLKATAILPVKLAADAYTGDDVTGNGVIASNALYGATYEVILPSDYLHILNCICNYKVKKQFKCYNPDSFVQFSARRLTSDLWSQIINNFYMRPMYKRPYFYIHNVNTNVANPTNPYQASTNSGTDITSATTSDGTTTVTGGLPKTIKIGNNAVDAVERSGQIRFGNTSQVRMEIRYGKDTSLFELVNVYIDYLKTPQNIRLTQEQLDLTEDTSQMMEFPDYVCQEIINVLVRLVMENSSDPRLQTHIPVNTTIANPAQAQSQPNKK